MPGNAPHGPDYGLVANAPPDDLGLDHPLSGEMEGVHGWSPGIPAGVLLEYDTGSRCRLPVRGVNQLIY